MDEKNLEELNEEILNELNEMEKMPMYAMTLANKELFHSNFWKWIFDYEKEKMGTSEFLHVFFYDLECNKITAIKREEGHRDITIWCGNDAYVIENKLKSSADIEQLQRYSKDITDKKGKNFVCGVLTGISNGNESPSVKNWKFVSYSAIADKLEKIFKNDNSFKVEVIKNYTKMIRELSRVIEKLDKINKGKFLFTNGKFDDTIKKIDELKLRDVWQKRQADKFRTIIEKDVASKLKEVDGYKIKVASGYTHGHAYVESFYISEIEESDSLTAIKKIGVQIQEKQFRYCIEGYGKGKNDQKKLFNTYKADWFYKKDKKILKNVNGQDRETGQKNEYCKFDPDFVYQYWKIHDDEAGFETLIKEIDIAIKKAYKVLKK